MDTDGTNRITLSERVAQLDQLIADAEEQGRWGDEDDYRDERRELRAEIAATGDQWWS